MARDGQAGAEAAGALAAAPLGATLA